MTQKPFIKHKNMLLNMFIEDHLNCVWSCEMASGRLSAVTVRVCVCCGVVFMSSATEKSKCLSPGCIPVLQEVVFREDSEKGGLGVAQRSCFGVQGSCFLSSLSEGIELPQTLVSCSVVITVCVWCVCAYSIR